MASAKLGCLTVNDLIHLIRTSDKQTGGERGEEGAIPQWAALDHLYAIKEWLWPHMKGLHGLRSHYHFAFLMENESVVMHYKQWSSDDWDASEYSPVEVLNSLPSGMPNILKPDYETVDLRRLQGMVAKGKEIGALGEEDVNQWNTFLEKEREKSVLYDSAERIELEGIRTTTTTIIIHTHAHTIHFRDFFLYA